MKTKTKIILIVLTAIAMMFADNAWSQSTIKQDSQGNYYQVKDTSISKGKETGKFFTDTKGDKYPVYESQKGKLYIIRISKKTLQPYKQYLKLEN